MELKSNKFLTVLNFAHNLLLFCAIYPFIGYMMEIDRFSKGIFLFAFSGIFLIFAITISYYMLSKIKNLFLFMLLGIICSAAIGGLSFIYGIIFLGFNNKAGYTIACVCINFLISMLIFALRAHTKILHGQIKSDFMAHRRSDEPFTLKPWEIDMFLNKPSPVHWSYFIIIYILSLFTGFSANLHIIFFYLIADVIICFTYIYFGSFHEYIKKNKNVANLPIKTMKQVNYSCFIALLILLAVVIAPAVIYNKEPLAGLFTHHETTGNIAPSTASDSMELTSPGKSDNSTDVLIGETQINPPSKLLLFIEKVICVTLSILLIIFIAFIVLRFIFRISNNFKVLEEDEVIFLDTIEDSTENLKGEEKSDSFLSVNMKIRRKYRHTIQKHTNSTPSCHKTPTELEKDANLSKNISILHNAYLKARYSKDGCTKDDLKNL